MSRRAREGIGGLLWYTQCKDLALQQVMGFRPPADGEQMRMYHSLYLTSLMSLIELTIELYGKQIESGCQRALDGIGGQSGQNNLGYVRELRNAIVHRGTDICAAGTVILGQTCALSPPRTYHRLGKKGPFTAFAPLLRNVFAACEDSVGPVVLDAAAQALVAEEQASVVELAAEAREAIEISAHMPDWARKMAIENIDLIPFEELRGFQAKKLRSLLSRRAPPGLLLPVETG